MCNNFISPSVTTLYPIHTPAFIDLQVLDKQGRDRNQSNTQNKAHDGTRWGSWKPWHHEHLYPLPISKLRAQGNTRVPQAPSQTWLSCDQHKLTFRMSNKNLTVKDVKRVKDTKRSIYR